jgi:GT2 family glycosyltransferase
VNHTQATVVIATRNRKPRLLATLARLTQLPEVAEIVVADNASADGTADAVRTHFPLVRVMALPRNLGAYARTLGATVARTDYVAFCDDDAWWTGGSIRMAAETLTRYPDIALVNARVVLHPSGSIDTACRWMEASAPVAGIPGHPILFFQAGAAVVRTKLFLECGGYDRTLFIGGEETLLSVELARRGWRMQYLPSIEVRHAPSALERDDGVRRCWTIRNRLLVAWMRYRLASAARMTLEALRRAPRDRQVRAALLRAIAKAHWALPRRIPIDRALQRQIDALPSPPFA